MSLISLVVGLIVILLVFWAAKALLGAFSIGEPIATVIYVLLVVFVILWLISNLLPASYPARIPSILR